MNQVVNLTYAHIGSNLSDQILSKLINNKSVSVLLFDYAYIATKERNPQSFNYTQSFPDLNDFSSIDFSYSTIDNNCFHNILKVILNNKNKFYTISLRYVRIGDQGSSILANFLSNYFTPEYTEETIKIDLSNSMIEKGEGRDLLTTQLIRLQNTSLISSKFCDIYETLEEKSKGRFIPQGNDRRSKYNSVENMKGSIFSLETISMGGSISSSNPILEGYIKKLGLKYVLYPGWRKRYFSLNMIDRKLTLDYFTDKNKTIKKGSLVLNSYIAKPSPLLKLSLISSDSNARTLVLNFNRENELILWQTVIEHKLKELSITSNGEDEIFSA